jgi:Uma2 family endonuclease
MAHAPHLFPPLPPEPELRRLARGSCWDPDGTFYPCEEERTVPLSVDALRLIFYLYQAFRALYADRTDVFVGADQFIYWVQGDPDQKVAPDAYVIHGVPSEPYRDVIKVWEEGVAPQFVAEISSRGSRTEDRVRKHRLYRDVLGCEEYLIYDVPQRELILHRLHNKRYLRVQPDARGRLHSQVLDCWFGKELGNHLRVYRRDGTAISQFEELAADAARLDGIRLRLEAEARDLEARLEREQTLRIAAQRETNATRQAVLLAEERAAAERTRREQAEAGAEAERTRREQAEAELERLRAEAARRRNGSSG